MTLQARVSQWDHRLYNVNRDLAHNFGSAVMELANRLDDERWPFLHELCRQHKVTDEQLAKALQALCKFVRGAADDPREGMYDVLLRSGWEEVPEAAQVVIMAYLGSILSGYYFIGAREATIGGEGPCLTYKDLAEYGHRCLEMMRRPRWRRWLDRAIGLVRRWWLVWTDPRTRFILRS